MITGKLSVPYKVSEINCRDCPYFQWEKTRYLETGTHAMNMIKNNICLKRDNGSCDLGVGY